MEISIKWNICRICLQEESKIACRSSSRFHMRNIFDEGKKLAHHIYEFSGIIIKPNDSLPEKICPECFKKINNAVQFRKTCRTSNTYLQSILQRAKSASSLLKQKIPCSISDDELEEKEDAMKAEHYIGNLNIDNIDKAIGVRFQDSNMLSVVTDDVKLEETIGHSEDTTEEILSSSIENSLEETNPNITNFAENNDHSNKDEKNVISKAYKLREGYFNLLKHHGDDKVRDTPISLENKTDDMNIDTDEVYYITEDIKNQEPSQTDNHENIEDQHPTADESMENCSNGKEEEKTENKDLEEDMEEELMLYLEHETEDTLAQVSSTVETNDEIEYDEQNSEASIILSEVSDEFIVDNNFYNKETTDGTEIVTKTQTEERNKSFRLENSRNSPNIFHTRKTKRNSTKSNNRSVTTPLVSVCEICGNRFSNRALMNHHMKVHYQEKNHECEICGKRFLTACNLQAHMRIHTGEKPFECKYCGRRFNDRTSSVRHERIHTNEKPFRCDNCGKTFSLATSLKSHMKVHTNERTFRCEPCGKSFKLVHHLKTHQNTSLHHSVISSLETN